MNSCVFCNIDLDLRQSIVLSNEYCLFLQLEQFKIKGSQLEGSGLIVPKKHRETVFDLSPKEWKATHSLLHEVKQYIDEKYEPQGYNLGRNCGEVGG